jgi:hypothetical protein
MTQVDKNFVATGQLSALDGMGPSSIATAGAVENFAVIRKMARLGTINRALIEIVSATRHVRKVPNTGLMHRSKACCYSTTSSAWTNSVGGTVGLSAPLRSGWERTDRRLSPSSFFAQ